ncbi:MAG: hypothetical protein AAFY15_04340 [Cyanobacteria bacterium J06648_11]
MTRHFTGIGSRRTPPDIGRLMTAIARTWCDRGWILRSGGATGADTYFENGVHYFDHIQPEIYLPWPKFNGKNFGVSEYASREWHAAEAMASEIHPNWKACSNSVRALHTRNVFQVLGLELSTPSEFVVYWAPETADGEVSGGTRTAVMLARSHGIPTYNLLWENVRERFEAKIDELSRKNGRSNSN